MVDDTVSREHLRIELESGGRFRIRDLGSRNKTFVNGELISETYLASGDVVRAGARVLEFLDEDVPRDKIELTFLTPDRTEPPHCDWWKIKQPISLTQAQVERLSQLAPEPRVTGRVEDIAYSALGQLLLDVQADRGLIALRGDTKTTLFPLAHRGLKRLTSGSLTPVSQTFVMAPILQSVGGRYPDAASGMNTELGYAVTALAVPLAYHGEILGVLYLDRPSARKPFTSSDLQYAVAAGAYCGAVIAETSRRLVRTATREGAAWVGGLRRIQSLLTSPVTGSATFAASSKCLFGRAKCGDFADFIHLDEERCAVLVVDGGGHGIVGLAQSNAIRASVRTALAVNPDCLMDPSSMFAGINAWLMGTNARRVLPCVYAGFDLAAGKMAYVNAGGMPPLLMPAPGRLMTLDQVTLVLGVDSDCSYAATRVDLPDAFRVILLTDGLVESANSAGETVGSQRIHESLLEHTAFGGVQEIQSRIESAYTAHLAGSQPDDDALMVVIGRG